MSKSAQEDAQHLLEHGYVVVCIWDDRTTAEHRRDFDKALLELREYKPVPVHEAATEENPKSAHAKTGFGALATPSAFHNEFVRGVRLQAYSRVVPILAAYDRMSPNGFVCDPARPWNIIGVEKRPTDGSGQPIPRKVHELIDRMLIRKKGMAPGKESWHRDVAHCFNFDVIFGGWLALTPQTASLIPGTHTVPPGGVGFSAVTDKAQIADYNARRFRVNVPAGCILIMHQNIVHEVVPNPHRNDDPMRRVFMGWRLTYENDPLIEHLVPRNKGTGMSSRRDGPPRRQSLADALDNQETVKLPSDQWPDIYNEKSIDMPKQRGGLETWLRRFIRDDMREPILYADGRDKFPGGAPPRLWLPFAAAQEGADRPAYSVRWVADRTGRTMYPEYSTVERDILQPKPLEFVASRDFYDQSQEAAARLGTAIVLPLRASSPRRRRRASPPPSPQPRRRVADSPPPGSSSSSETDTESDSGRDGSAPDDWMVAGTVIYISDTDSESDSRTPPRTAVLDSYAESESDSDDGDDESVVLDSYAESESDRDSVVPDSHTESESESDEDSVTLDL